MGWGGWGGTDTRWARQLRWAQQLQHSAARHSDAAVWLCSAYHPRVGKKFCSCFRSLLSGSDKRKTPRLSRASVLLMGWQQAHLFSLSKDRTKRPCIEAAKITRHLRRVLFGWSIFFSSSVCEFRCGHEFSIVPTAPCHSDVQLTNM